MVIVNDSNQIVNVFSRTKLLEWFMEDPARVPEMKASLKVSDFDLVETDVATVTFDSKVIDAFRTMQQKGLSSVGVVDEQGNLCGTLSVSDLKVSFKIPFFFLFCLNSLLLLVQCVRDYHFMRLLLPIHEFLHITREEQGKPSNWLITCSPHTTLKEAARLLTSNRIHRLFVVDNRKKPLAVISASDILRQLS
jgi:CBS domain-containing protein